MLVCPGSLTLPRNDTGSPAAREAAAWGTMVHRWKATGEILAEPEHPQHDKLFRYRLHTSGTDRAVWWPGDGKHEVGVAVNTLTGAVDRRTGPGPDIDAWKASQPDEAVVGTADWVGTFFGEPWVDDLKTGKAEYLVPAGASQQLLLYAYALSGGAPAVWVSITHWPRYPRDQQPVRTMHRHTRDDLDSFFRRLVSTRNKVLLNRSLPIDETIGLDASTRWCVYCPSRAVCPERRKQDNGN